MKTEIITCDVCGHQFTGKETWEATPCKVEFLLQSPPRQAHESCSLNHVCWTCVESLKAAFQDRLNERTKLRSGNLNPVLAGLRP